METKTHITRPATAGTHRSISLRIGMLILLALALSAFGLKAAHQWGVSLRYECLGNNIYRIHWTGVRDCIGAPGLPNTTTVEALLPNCTLPTPINPWSSITATDITPMCPSQPTRCTTPGGMFWGVEEQYAWRDYDFSNATCSTYKFTMLTLRTSYIDTGPGFSNLYMETSPIDLSLVACNSNPVFDHPQLMFMTAGQPAVYSQSATDPDGDSLVYSLAPCLESATQFVPYDSTFSGTAPLGTEYSMTIDPHSGDVEILPTPGNASFNAQICIKVTEYRNGVRIGEVIRDHILIIIAAVFPNHYPEIQPYSGLNAVHQTLNDTLYVSAGYPFGFEVPVFDADTADQLFLTWDQNIPGMNLIDPATGNVTDTVWGNLARFEWTPAQIGTFPFLFEAWDNACPLDGFAQNTITVVVDSGFPPVSGTAHVQATGCHTFDFSALPQYGTPPYSYEWSGGGGLSNSPNRFDSAFTHVYAQPGTYAVSLTIIDSTGDSHLWTGQVSSEAFVEGTVLSSSGGPYAYRWVYLMELNALDSTTQILDSTATDQYGYYSFCLADSQVSLSVWPDVSAFPNDLPTYLDSGLVFQDSRSISPGLSATANIQVQGKTVSSGNASLGGVVRKGNNLGLPVEGLRLVLLNGAGEPVDWTRTDAAGAFHFPTLAVDSYFVWVDKPFVDNQMGPVIRLDAGMTHRDSLELILHPTWLELFLPVAHIEENENSGPDLSEAGFEIGPNPFTHRFRIRGILPYVGPVRVHLLDLEGRVLLDLHWENLPQGPVDLDVDPGVLPSGLYLLKIETDSGTIIRRVLRSTPD